MQTILNTLRSAQARDRRAVVLVPEAEYLLALYALGCLYESNAGRSAMMPNGNLVTILAPKTPPSEVGEVFDLYLCGWGGATNREQNHLGRWLGKATGVYTELS